MVDSCRVFTYSPNNIYANDYYNACKKFDNIRNKVIEYEHSTDDRESPEYQAMMREFTYWDAQVPKMSNIAGAEEDRLIEAAQQKKNTKPEGVGENLDIMG